MYKINIKDIGKCKAYVQKIMLIMRLTIVLMIATLMQVSAKVSAQKISFTSKNVTMERIISVIKEQTGYNFIISSDQLESLNLTSANFKDASLEEVLTWTLKGSGLTYVIDQGTIVIKAQKKSIIDKIKDYLQEIDIKGKVLDNNGKPLVGAVIRIKGTSKSTITNENGEFKLSNLAENSIIQINYVGYLSKEFTGFDLKNNNIISLLPANNNLDEVKILSTGYQSLSKERATGSFEQIDNKLFNRKTGTDVISRLDGITTSGNFGSFSPTAPLNHRINSVVKFSIRGLSTLLTAGKAPLVVVDNFPYEGDINNINPNDVENITILKDAAAASIWGTRAGNGVIVITTKKGGFEQPVKVSVSSNVTIGQRPDLYYIPQMKSSDLIDLETSLYKEGLYNDYLNYKIIYVSPVVDLLDRQSQDPSNPIYTQKLNELRKNDIRKDLNKYVYRNSINQQHALNLSGGNKQITFYLSGGYDKNLESVVTDSYSRINLRMNTVFRPIKNLDIDAGIFYTQNKYDESLTDNSSLFNFVQYPYVKLADDQGNPLSVFPNTIVRKSYLDTAGNGRLLDWGMKPLAELNSSPRLFTNQDVLLNIGATYRINPIFSASVKYQYEKNNGDETRNTTMASWYLRNIINTYSQYSKDDPNGVVERPVPLGNLYGKSTSDLISNSIRGQLNADKAWGENHSLNAIAGAEIREVTNKGFSTPNIFGFNDELLNFTPAINTIPVALYNDADFWGTEIPPTGGIPTLTRTANRFTSYFTNISYTYKKRYILSGSARKDASNIFGAEPNRRGQPLWSTGLSWNISEEPYFKVSYLNYLKLRVTYGYLGNTSNTNSAYPIIAYQPQPNSINQLPYATNTNPPNAGLGWEKTGTLNFGLDFSAFNNRISGTIEYYNKQSKNLIANTPIPSSTGFTTIPVNSANLHGKGFELTLQTINVNFRNFQWRTNYLFSYNRNIVSKYFISDTRAQKYVMNASGALQFGAFKEGDDAFSLYAYKWAGLNPETGASRGYLNGEISEDYAAIIAGDVNSLQNMGSISPRYFGSFRNTFTWKGLSLSLNIQYKFKYVLARQAINYSALADIGGKYTGHADYVNRWQNPGDELKTNVPAFTYPIDPNSTTFYTKSSANVISGSHIRLQDIVLSHTFHKGIYHLQDLKIFANMNNVGILWKANKMGIDPDAGNYMPVPRSFSFGLNASF